MSQDDKYTYPDSGGVLVNRLDIRDPVRLDEALNDYATAGWFAVRRQAVPERPDFGYLRRIHRELFGDVLDWAGQLRETNTTASGTSIAYARPEYIDESLRSLFGRLDREDYLRGLDAEPFAQRLAERWGELTAIHPFRDGNTRSQSIYFSALAHRAGHPVDWTRVEVSRLRELRLAAITGRDGPLGEYLRDRLLEQAQQLRAPLADLREPAAGRTPGEAARIAAMDTPTPPRAGPPATASRRAAGASPPGRTQRRGPEAGLTR